MLSIFRKSNIEIVYTLAKFGLVHGKRNCQFCNQRMYIVESSDSFKPLGIFW